MTKVGVDDFIVATRATTADIDALPRQELAPLIHLVDIEKTEFVGRIVRTDIIVAGVGETFHIPRAWRARCSEPGCVPRSVDLRVSPTLLKLPRMSQDQLTGLMRTMTQCRHRPAVEVTQWTTITDLLAMPAATADGATRDYREKVVALVGSLQNSNIRYRATGEVVPEPRQQRATLLITRLAPLQSATEDFRLTPEIIEAFKTLQAGASLDAVKEHPRRLAATVTATVTKVYGTHRVYVLLAELLVYHSLREIPWAGERIKGTLDFLAIGDTGQGKTSQFRRLSAAIQLGHFASGSTSSRTGILYTLDSKVNDKRVLRWGAFPLAHGELLAIDEAQNIKREEWQELTTARSEGVLKVDRAIRAEHPSRTRLIAFANPLGLTSMADFQYGIMAVHPTQGFISAQDLRRFDLIACVTEGDQTAADIQAGVDPADILGLPINVLRSSVLWAWTRDARHVDYGDGTLEAIRAQASTLQQRFGAPELPLLITDADEKLARVAVAFAALLHSTDVAHERLIVLPPHVDLAERLFTTFYSHDNCGLDQYVRVIRHRTGLTDEDYAAITEVLLTPGSNREDVYATETILDLFTTEDDVPRFDLEAASGLGRDALNSRLGRLRAHRLIKSGARGYRKTPRFVAFLRRWSLTRANPPNPSQPDLKRGSPGDTRTTPGDPPGGYPIPRVRRVRPGDGDAARADA